MDLFGTAGIRGPIETRVTPELALSVGRAAGLDAREHGNAEFAVGRDGRISGPTLQRALVAGLQSAGVAVRLVGEVPTPALAFASQGRRGVMLTASHNPPADNGLKLFCAGVEYDAEAEARIEARVAADDDPAPWDTWTRPRREPVLDAYREAVVEYAGGLGAPLDGLPVAVDCGNGMASVATPQVLDALGAEVTALSANVDGRFPARESKPTPETLTDLRAYVASTDAAIGFGADGDADRLVVVDGDGEVVHEDTVLAILAEAFVAGSEADDPVVVTTPNASARVDERVAAAGGRVERVALGYVHEGIADARSSGATVAFAGEPWKHVHPALGGWIDGVASAAVLARLVADAGGLGPLREPVNERPYRKVSVDCPDDRKADAMARLEDALPATFDDATVDTGYGIRLDRPDASWVLVRPSGTEPYVRVYAEGEDVDVLVERAVEAVEAAVDAAG
ncbi:MAG: phosphomannomutase [Halobacteriales archaeon]|nr:phosphomannomutase [Halobacteriales archaeon]